MRFRADVSHETMIYGVLTPLCILLDFVTLLELTTGGVDIIASGIANRRLDASRGESALQVLNLMDR